MIVLIVHTHVKPGTEEEVVRICREVTEATRKEPGCLLYVIQQSNENPTHFVFYEQYKDAAALDAHRATPHFARYREGIEDLVESRVRELFTPVA
jgi:quinol monooxygenase YgiN